MQDGCRLWQLKVQCCSAEVLLNVRLSRPDEAQLHHSTCTQAKEEEKKIITWA
jgi:hypothetical protein